ncbi:DUF2306 domain-containing protein [Enterovibrio sp. ZSDZ35]|uniref:DUF2306 domain-containing protein n=1 Tax=Enterovibrio qingdaonensis TaxID=2899818 RepID=A0ABT5QFW2_9GAMM|nr:DUF2306 domain-containing protein [Enterovibrio sp. ZSDZ35]MDD1779876.1 DUF2306 domain-containing protein [Enterovibrio sp. ZSDZ35]
MTVEIHLIAAIWLLIAGTMQLIMRKGTQLHKVLGRSWMLAMVIVAFSSFGLPGFVDWFMGYGPIHLLSLWVLFCVYQSVRAIKRGNINKHRAYATGAFYGAVGAAIAAVLVPNRLLNSLIF